MDNYIGMTTLNGKNEGLGSGSTGDQSHKQCPNSESSKSCRCCHRLGSLLCSNLGLSLLILGYSTLGAFLFSQLESLSEKQRINQVIALRNLTVAKLWRITENTNILKEENWTAMTTNEIIKFQKLLYQAFMEGFDGREAVNPKADQWSFTGAFLYSITVITTIGYGNIGPRTMEGKMLTILYALLGIPLMILFLSKMGSMLANGLRYFYRSCCSCLPSPSASTLPNSGTLDILDPVHLSSSSGLLSHHAHHSHHHLHDHYHVHHISLNDIHNNTTGHVALHCNSTSPNTTGTLGIVCKGTPGTTTCYGGSGTCNAITVSGSGGGGGGVALSPTVVSMGNSVGPLGGTLGDSETKICPETEVPEHYTTCGGLLLNRHSHATILRGDTLHHHGDHINATLATCQGDHSDYRYQETNHHHPGSSPCNHLINLTSATNNSNPTSKTNDNQMNNKMCDNNYNSNYYPKTVPITLCCIIIAVYIFAGASVFYLWEGWSYWESVYFCFASISTIGLGQATWILSDFRNSEKKLILCCLYILFGLSLGAMVFNLYQDHLRRKLSNSKCAKRHSTECPHHLTERELLTATPAPNNPLLGEDDFDV